VSVSVLRADDLSPRDVGDAFRESGGFILRPSIDAELSALALKAAHDFFALPAAVKAATAIELSRHFRGWSEMHNERDWREQIHIGCERSAAGDEPPFRRLEGPNLWPPDENWRAIITAYMETVARLGERVLTCAATDLGFPFDTFAGVGRDGYLLLKLIGYHPQPPSQRARPGVASHVDFSWITVTLQDSAGLEVLQPRGQWVRIEPIPRSLWIHPGELLQVASGGTYPATPHRVTNRSIDRTRVSLPLFLNPPLTGQVGPLVASRQPVAGQSDVAPHVHRVFGSVPTEPFHFGEAEWRRKGLNGWCHACAPPLAK
jgi:isopenicillin N synthase-like dioxygenase